jgi:membrane protease YdiL (CAAX protease family)
MLSRKRPASAIIAAGLLALSACANEDANAGPFGTAAPSVQFVALLGSCAVYAAIALLWARWSKLDLGLSAPAFRRAEPWVLFYILWSTARWALPLFLPNEVDSEWLKRMSQLSLGEAIIVIALLGPVAEELLLRGAMFAALLRRWGIWAAVLVPSLIGGLLHPQYEWWAVISIIGSGILLAMVRWKGGSLYLPVGLHAAWNLLVTLANHGFFGSAA